VICFIEITCKTFKLIQLFAVCSTLIYYLHPPTTSRVYDVWTTLLVLLKTLPVLPSGQLKHYVLRVHLPSSYVDNCVSLRYNR